MPWRFFWTFCFSIFCSFSWTFLRRKYNFAVFSVVFLEIFLELLVGLQVEDVDHVLILGLVLVFFAELLVKVVPEVEYFFEVAYDPSLNGLVATWNEPDTVLDLVVLGLLVEVYLQEVGEGVGVGDVFEDFEEQFKVVDKQGSE